MRKSNAILTVCFLVTLSIGISDAVDQEQVGRDADTLAKKFDNNWKTQQDSLGQRALAVECKNDCPLNSVCRMRMYCYCNDGFLPDSGTKTKCVDRLSSPIRDDPHSSSSPLGGSIVTLISLISLGFMFLQL